MDMRGKKGRSPMCKLKRGFCYGQFGYNPEDKDPNVNKNFKDFNNEGYGIFCEICGNYWGQIEEYKAAVGYRDDPDCLRAPPEDIFKLLNDYTNSKQNSEEI